MKKDKFDQVYLEIIKQSQDWKDSLGGKLVTGVGSLFKGGAKAVSAIGKGINKGISNGAKFTTNAITNYIKDSHTRENFKEIVTRISSLYDPETSNPSALIENKSELMYIINSSKDALPGSLSKFLNIFEESGKELKQLITNDKSINVNLNNIINLIKQPITLKIDKFKQQIESKALATIKENKLYTDVYLDIIMEATSGVALNAFNIFNSKSYISDKSTNPYELHKEYTNRQLQSILSSQLISGGILSDMRQFIINDKLNMKVNINDDKIIFSIISEVISQQFKKQISTIDDPIAIDDNIKTALIEFYNNPKNQRIRQNNLIKAKLRNLSVLILASNRVINSLKWAGWFGDLKGILRDAANCKLDVEDIKFLAKIYFQLALLKK